MCGIYGTTWNYDQRLVEKKMTRMDFRGPDYTAVKRYKIGTDEVIFGHNRLSIIDLDPRSNQPFDYKGVSIVFNGEIYNFASLKKELLAYNHEFNTYSDTEVVCAAYLEWGEKCVTKFNGMFSFVILDRNKHIMFGARDRLGKKPLYYTTWNNEFEFSSQISTIPIGRSDLTISSTSIVRYLAWGNIPDPDSIFNGVKKIRAGHCFTYSLNTKALKIQKYWDIDNSLGNSFSETYEHAMARMEDLLTDAVKSRLFADVPIGVYLSGGIDSSLVAALATKLSFNPIKTFSISFKEAAFDESKYAETVASYLGTQHTTIECSISEGMELIHNMTTYFDEPFADASAIPSMLLAKHTRKNVTVALSGDGGDECFLGYKRYQWILNARKAFKLPQMLRKIGGKILAEAPNYRLKLIGEGIKLEDIERFYLYTLGGLDNSWIRSDFDPKVVDEVKYLKTELPLEQRMGDFDLKTYLIWDINTKVDRSSMAFSLETRAPLLDYRVVELARTFPVSFKVKSNIQKRILKDILYRHVPKHLFDRPKAGFSMPFNEWFRTDLRDYVLQELNSDALKDIPCIDNERVRVMIGQHMNGTWNRYPQIWKLLVLKQWLRKEGQGHALR